MLGDNFSVKIYVNIKEKIVIFAIISNGFIG